MVNLAIKISISHLCVPRALLTWCTWIRHWRRLVKIIGGEQTKILGQWMAIIDESIGVSQLLGACSHPYGKRYLG